MLLAVLPLLTHALMQPVPLMASRAPASRSAVRMDLPYLDGAGALRNIDYPTTMDIKVIGDNEGPFVQDIVQLCAENSGNEVDDIEVRWRDKGKYRAVTVRLEFQNADQVYAVYAPMDRDPRVRYKL